jgi:hypothetical protein
MSSFENHLLGPTPHIMEKLTTIDGCRVWQLALVFLKLALACNNWGFASL